MRRRAGIGGDFAELRLFSRSHLRPLACMTQDPEFPGMLIKVRDGTPLQHADALCDTCRHATVIRGRRLDEQLVFCRGVAIEPVRITFTVIDCSDYHDVREPTYHELLEKAWILRPSTKRHAAGFVRASDLNPREAARVLADPTERE